MQVSINGRPMAKHGNCNMQPERLIGTKWKPNFMPVPFFRGAGSGKDLPREINLLTKKSTLFRHCQTTNYKLQTRNIIPQNVIELKIS